MLDEICNDRVLWTARDFSPIQFKGISPNRQSKSIKLHPQIEISALYDAIKLYVLQTCIRSQIYILYEGQLLISISNPLFD
jgi:hypothetical protein